MIGILNVVLNLMVLGMLVWHIIIQRQIRKLDRELKALLEEGNQLQLRVLADLSIFNSLH